MFGTKLLRIDLNDIYGRTIPGMLLLVGFYFIAMWYSDAETCKTLKEAVGQLYEIDTLIFVLGFAIIGFLVGHLPLYIIFWITNPFWKRSLVNHIRLEKLDVTKNNDLVNLFEKRFSKHALENNQNKVLDLCIKYLAGHHPSLYSIRKDYEAGANLRGGMVIPCVFLGAALIMHEQIVYGVTTILIAGLFLIYFIRNFKTEQTLIIWLYYVANLSVKDTELAATDDRDAE